MRFSADVMSLVFTRLDRNKIFQVMTTCDQLFHVVLENKNEIWKWFQTVECHARVVYHDNVMWGYFDEHNQFIFDSPFVKGERLPSLVVGTQKMWHKNGIRYKSLQKWP
jgi:hypothetical protein